jgi:hypothetical protein
VNDRWLAATAPFRPLVAHTGSKLCDRRTHQPLLSIYIRGSQFYGEEKTPQFFFRVPTPAQTSRGSFINQNQNTYNVSELWQQSPASTRRHAPTIRLPETPNATMTKRNGATSFFLCKGSRTTIRCGSRVLPSSYHAS